MELLTSPFELVFPLCPVAASRPRHAVRGRGKKCFTQTYFTGKYADFRKDAARVLLEILPFDWEPLEDHLRVDSHFVVDRPRTTKLSYPGPDCDNYLKAAWDVCNDKVWVDDKQIVCGYFEKRWTEPEEDAHLRLVITPV